MAGRVKTKVPVSLVRQINTVGGPAPYLTTLLSTAASGGSIEIDFTRLKRPRIEELQRLVAALPASHPVGKVRLVQLVESYLGAPVGDRHTTLQSLCAALKSHAAAVPSHHIMVTHAVHGYLPALITDITVVPPTRWNPAYLKLSTSHVGHAGVEAIDFCWTLRDIGIGWSRPNPSAARDDVDDDDDDGSDEEPDEVIPEGTQRGATVSDALNMRRLVLASAKTMEDFNAEYATYQEECIKVGDQYTADCAGNRLASKGSWYSSAAVSLLYDGKPSRVINDDDYEEGRKAAERRAQLAKDFTGQEHALIHWPLLRVFGIRRRQHYIVRLSNLKPYEYDEEMVDKLIIPVANKRVIRAVCMSSCAEMADIVEGKSAGTIIIASGPPGTGKTLTAEAMSEALHRPLYSISATELGTSEEEIETRLSRILKRAQRWNAMLLIDEADVYVRRRGADIQQSAIVGTFLRLIEYYQGVLFMTTNLGNDIDDAIISRATVHIRYDNPDVAALETIFATHAVQVGFPLDAAEITKCANMFRGIAGRDVRRLLRLGVISHTAGDDRLATLAAVAPFASVSVYEAPVSTDA